MYVEFAFFASSATAVAPRNTRWRSRAAMTAIPVGMTIGMQLARAYTVTSAVFVTNRRARTVAIVDDGAARLRGASAGLTEAARSDAASAGSTGTENGPKKGVMTYDAGAGGHQAVRHGAAANVTGS